MKPLIALTIAVAAYATHANADAGSMGAGSTTCGQFAQEYVKFGEQMEWDYFEWAQGYMSGRDASQLHYDGTSRDLQSKPVPEQQLLIRQYCDAHPLQNYSQAVDALFGQLAPNATVKPLP